MRRTSGCDPLTGDVIRDTRPTLRGARGGVGGEHARGRAVSIGQVGAPPFPGVTAHVRTDGGKERGSNLTCTTSAHPILRAFVGGRWTLAKTTVTSFGTVQMMSNDAANGPGQESSRQVVVGEWLGAVDQDQGGGSAGGDHSAGHHSAGHHGLAGPRAGRPGPSSTVPCGAGVRSAASARSWGSPTVCSSMRTLLLPA